MKKIFGIAVLFAAMFACTEPVNPEPDSDSGANTNRTYTCLLPVVEFGKTAWEPGDKILFHGGSADNQKIITLKQEDIVDDTLCTVDLSGLKPYKTPTSNVKYFAAYPAELVKNEGQCKDMNTFTKANTLLMSGYAAADTVFFKYITGGLVFTVNGNFDSYEMVGNYGETIGYETVSCRITDRINVLGINQTGAMTTRKGSVVADGKTLNTIYFPYSQPSFVDGFKLYMCKDGKRVLVMEELGQTSLSSGAFVNLGDITSQLVEDKEPDNSAHEPDVLPDYSHLNHLSFTESDDVIANPERGFYFVQNFKRANASILSKSTIESNRLQNRTICYLGFYPKQYMNGDIADDFLQMVRKNMQVLRENGAKCIMRFAYSDSENEKPWDPSPEVVQKHIKNIKPILQEYSDVIMCLQAGFVGVWGEWYYTENFVFAPETPEEHALRKEVIDAMLDALPADRTVGLRTPMFKRMMYSESYRDTLTIATAYGDTPQARLCGFNDCFGASVNDLGTFDDVLSRNYWKNDTRYTLMGGETCGVSQYCECPVSIQDMEDYHWTYLNIEYNRDVHNVWKNGGCWNEVERRLGYRLSLADVYYSTPKAGDDMTVALQIKNTGFAAPMNGRAVELVLVDGNGTKTVYELNDVDPRYWFAGRTMNIEKTISIPQSAQGKCVLYLNLPDPKPTLRSNPLFSIRLANDNVWDKNQGYNKVIEFNL